MRLVLDTNVWLDWLVFEDASVAPLQAAVAAGTASVFVDAACEQELARVLAYPRARTTLDAHAQSERLAACRRIARHDDAVTRQRPATAALPRCRDADDQKFLELARECGADALVTRDRALLELDRRSGRPLGFRVFTPEQLAVELRAREEAAAIG